MYIPYRKAYLTGMNPLSFIAFFTIRRTRHDARARPSLYGGGPAALSHQLELAKPVLFWLMLGGFVWVIGDLFPQYAAKYIGISRGIPLSNTNQLWGLLWGILVFGELRGLSSIALRASHRRLFVNGRGRRRHRSLRRQRKRTRALETSRRPRRPALQC